MLEGEAPAGVLLHILYSRAKREETVSGVGVYSKMCSAIYVVVDREERNAVQRFKKEGE